MPKPADSMPHGTHQSIAESEGRFRALISAASEVIYSLSPDWKTMRELVGRNFMEDTATPDDNWIDKYIPIHEQHRVKEAIDDALARRSMLELEHQVIRADRTIGWVLSRTVPICDDQGHIIEWFGAASNITDRKKAEHALQLEREKAEQQKRLYETIASSTPDLIYVFDLDYRFTYANSALLTMWGKTWEEAIGKRLIDNGYEDWHAEMHEREIDHIKATKEAIRGEVSFPHAVLGRRIYDYIFTPVFDEHGEVEAVAGTTRDITDIRNSEHAILESEQRFRTMAEGTEVMIAVSDAHGNATYVNQQWEATMGQPSERLPDFGWIKAIHPEDNIRITEQLSDALKKENPWQCDFRVGNEANGYRWVLARATPRLQPDLTFTGYIISAIDITEIKENEQRKNDFISMVSHELKTPLTSISGFVQLLQGKASASKDALSENLLTRVASQLSKMTRLINGFLNVSRLETSQIFIDRQPFDMAQLLKEAEEETKLTVQGHQVVFEPLARTWIHGDRDKIGQVIHNLISNAAKYSAVGSTITVSGSVKDGWLELRLKDNGIGIDAEDLPKVFDRFYRVKNNETRSISGFGIGLYLCSEIIKGHGGRIAADSVRGQGSVFSFTLPLMVKAPEPGQG